MALRLSDSVKIDSTDGKDIRYTTALSSGIRTYEYECTNTSFYYRIFEIVKDYNSDLFDSMGGADSANIWLQPADSIFLGAKMRLDVQFSDGLAMAITDIDVTVGDGGNNTGILNPVPMNGVTDGVGTEYKDRGAYWNTLGSYYSGASKQWIAYSTSVGGPMDTLVAGQITFYFYYLEV